MNYIQSADISFYDFKLEIHKHLICFWPQFSCKYSRKDKKSWQGTMQKGTVRKSTSSCIQNPEDRDMYI